MNRTFKIIVVVLMILMLFLLLSNRPKVKGGFVTNETVEGSENPFFIYETVRYPSSVEILEKNQNRTGIFVGITGEPWNLNFGVLPRGIDERKFINLANHKEEIYKVEVIAYGNISPMISFDKNNFILHPNEEKKVEVFLNTSLSTKTGNFTGEIDVVSKRLKYQFLTQVLGWF